MPDTTIRHFLDIEAFGAKDLRNILNLAHAYKARGMLPSDRSLAGRHLAMIFQRPSTRTRVSFEVAMHQLGGDVIVLTAEEMQFGHGETIADTACVLSRYVDAVMLRCSHDHYLRDFSQAASVPVINGLTDRSHPCQIIADIMTFEEHRGSITGRVITWCGDGNNVATSWLQAAPRLGFEFRLGCPEEFAPDERAVALARAAGGAITVSSDLQEAVKGADCVVTDSWVSMHHLDSNSIDVEKRIDRLRPYQVNSHLLALAKPDVLVMHCLPAHRGNEITAEVIDGPHSVVFDEAENRLHAHKGILAWCFGLNC